MALGAIQLDTLDQRSRFQQEDLDVLASVAGQAAFVLENAQLHEQSLKQQSVQRDLELAHKVQQGLLPAAPPKIEEYHFFDFYEPANQVGGDYYDYVPLNDGRLAIVLGRRVGQGSSGGAGDGPAVGRRALLPGERGFGRGGRQSHQPQLSATAAGKTAS